MTAQLSFLANGVVFGGKVTTMRALSVIILFTALVLPSGCATVSPPIDTSLEDKQTLQTQAAQGVAEAQTNLGLLYYNGQGVPQDYAAARQWWEKAAAQGSADAQFNLGMLYAKGLGVPQDYVMARQWYERAAAQGRAEAQYSLGLLYYNGQGVPQDYAAARQWWEKAAAQGDAKAQTNLGMLYAKGLGVPQDYTTARQWWEKAAAQGSALAQSNIVILNNNGQGVPQDSAPSLRPAAATTQTTPDAFANIRNTEDMQKQLDSERQYLDRKVAAGQLTQEKADWLYQDRKESLAKWLKKN
jgi:TPR repeat protein